MATAMGSFGKQRIWNPNDSEDPSDTRRLYEADPPKTLKRGRCISTWTFSLLILAASVLFLMGLFIGYYVRESQSGPTNDSCNGVMQRKDSFNPQKLESIHKNHMNFLSSENVRRYIREFSTGEPELSNTHWDKTVVNHIRSEFNKFGLDKVDIQNHNIVVTYPDPERPNHLEIINSSGNVELNVSLGSIERDQDQPVFQSPQNDSMTNRVLYPYVAFSPPGVVKGGIVYGHYGHSTDFLHLWESGVETNGRVLLLRLGHTSVGEKMKLSAEAGAVGVLLYWDPVDFKSSDPHLAVRIPYASAGDSDQPVIPAQTVSMGIAQDLFKRMSGPAAPAGWQGGFEDLTYRIHPSATDPWEVRMAVYNKQDTAQITNVIGSIHGDSEPDRYVLIGASRTAFPSDASDTKTNTAVLMEIAHQLSEIQEVDGWSPRRGVRLCSWGGSELSQAGLRRYIEEKKNILMQKAVAYIDLDRLVERTDFVQFTAANSMVDLIMKAANKVPDANDPTNAVSELWLSRADDYSLINYYDDYPEQFPFLHSIGVPVLKVQYKGRELQTDAKNIREILNHDSQHHFKYHLTAARVASLMLLELVDDIQLPFNLMIYTLKIQQAVDSTVRILRKYPALDQKLLDIISEDAAALARAGGAYQDFVTSFKNIFDILSLRKTNDLLMIFDKFFLAELPEKSIGYKKTCPSLWESRTQHMLFRQDKAGAILLFTESAESSNFRNEWQTTAHLLEKLKTALQEAHSSLLSEDP